MMFIFLQRMNELHKEQGFKLWIIEIFWMKMLICQ